MDSFLGNTGRFFQGLPSSMRGYGHSASRDESHAPPTPTPPATPTLPPAHPYHPYPQPMTGPVPATSVPGLLPPSRPMTPVTPSHKPPDHSTSASPYNVPFPHPAGTKQSSADARFLQLEQQYRQGSLPAGSVVVPSSTRPRSHNNGQGLSVESRMSSRTHAKPPSLPGEGRSHMSVHTTQALGTDLRHSRIYNSTQPLPNDVRMFPHPYISQNSTDSRVAAAAAATAAATATAPPPPHSDSKYFPRPEPRPPDPRIPEARDLRADPHQEHWGPYGTPHTKSLERLAPSVHIAETSASVNGSKDARYLGKKPEEMANVSRPENALFRKSIESLQVNGSRDSLYPNGSHSIHSIETKRDPSSERKIDNRPKEDSALDLSVKTVRQTFDSSAASTEKSHSQSPHVITPLVEKSSKDPQRRTPSSSVPVSSPYSRTPSRDASPSQLSELIKNAPGISGTSKGASPSHSHQYGITGSPRPLEAASPLTQPMHMLQPTKRTGDQPYYDHASKYARLSLNPSSKAPPSSADHALDSSLISAHKDALLDKSHGLHLYVASPASKEVDFRYSGESKIEKRPLHLDARDHSADLSISIERKNPTLDIRDSRLERRDPVNESRDLSFIRKNAAPEGKDSNYDKRDTLTIEPKYPYGNHPASIPAVDAYRTYMMNYDHSKYNSVSIDRQKYVPGSHPVPTSVPTSLPHQNSRVPSAQLHSSYQHPPDTRLPQPPYTSQASHTAATARTPSQLSSAKIHQAYMQQSLSNSSGSSCSSNSRTSQIPSTQGNSHPSQSPGTAGHLNSASQPHYPYPYNHAVAAHYAQQQQQHHRQPRPPSACPPFSLPQNNKSPSLPPPALTPQQIHQPYLYPQHRNEPSLSLYPSKRPNQVSPRPSSSPHPSISPHTSASPNTSASPHPAASPHHMITSPRSAVSPHVAQQSRISQYSPHAAQRLPSASSMQHSYPGSHPPSPYPGHQSHVSHTTPPSSRPSSATSQHSLSSQTTTASSQPQRSPYPSLAHSQSPVNPPQSNTSHPSQTFPISSQSQSPHPSQGPPTHSSQTRPASHPQPPVSHSMQLSSPAVSSVQSQYSHASQHVTHHTQASISSQAHPTWVTPPYAGHTTKITEGNASQPHPSHSYPPQSYSHHPYVAKPPSQPRSSHPSPSPQHHPPHPSQPHPPSQARPPHPSQAHPAQQPSSSQSQPTRPSQVPAPQTQSPQAHPPHPSQPHPSQQPQQPPPSQAHPAPPSRSQANPPHPSASPAHPPHPSPSPAHAPHPSRSPAHPPHPSPSPAHSAHPSRSPAHPPHPSPSPAHPAHPSMSPAHPAHPSISSNHPPQPSPAHTSHPTQAHPSHPSQPPHPSQSQPLRHPTQPSQAHIPHPSQAHLLHPSQAHPPHPSQPHPPHPSQAHLPHPSQAHSLHPSQPHLSHPHPSQAHTPHPSQAHPPHPSQAHLPHPSQAHLPHPSQAHLPHPSQAHPPHPSQAHPPHPSQAHPPHPSQAHPPHPSQAHPSQAHPPHPSQAHHQHPSQAQPPHPSQAHPPHPSQAHPPHPSQAHPPHPSHAHPPHPSQAHSLHPSQAHLPHPHPSQAHHPHPSQTHPTPTSPQYPPPPQSQPTRPPQSQPPHLGQAQPPHATQAQPPHSSQAQPRSSSVHPQQDPSRQSSQAHPHPSQPPLSQQSQVHPSHPSNVYGSHPYPPHGPSSHVHPPNVGTSQGHSSQTRHMQGHHQPHNSRELPPHSQAQSHPQSHSPRGHSSQSVSPRGHASHPHPASGHPHAYPPQEYPPPSHPPHDSSLQAYSLHDHSSQSHPLMRLPYPSPVGSQSIHPHQSSDPYGLHPHVHHPTPGHPADSLQPHPHPGYPPHGHHPYYPPHQQYPHHPIKTENLAYTGSSQYPAYPYQSHTGGKQESLPPNRAQPVNYAQPSPGALSSPRPPQDFDPSRIRTKGEQKSFDPRNAESGNPDCKSEAQSGYQPNHQKVNSVPIGDVTKDQAGGTKPVVEGLKLSNLEGDQKVPVIGKEEGKAEVVQSASKALEPGKAALAVKLHKKLQHAESMESLETKKENIPENIVPKKEEKEEDDWDKGFDKLMEDLASNPDGVTSKKCRNLGRKYLHKVQIQNAIDNDLIVPPSASVEEEEDESEPEAPVKFRGKFKSIKDKKVERLILTYASHSDESALDMIPDEDASDFEEELKREIRLKSKKRGRDKKKVTGDSSSGSEAEKVGRKRSGGRGTNKENKPNNKQDSDFSFSTSNTSSDSSDSDSSDESDTEDSDLEELVRPGRKGKKSDNERRKLRKKLDSDSSDSEEEVLPQRRRRPGHKYSSDEDSFKPLQRSRKRRKKQDSSDSDEIPTKTSRRKRKSDSEEDDEVITRGGRKKGSLNKKFKKGPKEDSDEDSERETPRKTRGMKKKIQELKKGKRKKQMPVLSSDSEDINDKKDKKIDGRRKRGKIKAKAIEEDSSEESDIPTKKKSSPKSNVIVDSDESDSNSKNVTSTAKELSIEEPSLDEEKGESIKKEAKEEADVQEVEENLGDIDDDDDANKEPDSVIEKLKKIREEELNREDVQEMKAWLGEVNREIEKQLVKFQDLTLRNNWKKPQFGGGEDFLHGWQNEVKKYKEQTGRFPKKLCHAAKHQAASTPSKSSPRKAKDQDQAKDSPKRGSSSPAKNTRSKSGIIKTSMAVAEDTRLKVAARPEISSVMQRFFEKVLAETGSDSSKEESPCRKFTLGPFPAYGPQRESTGLTPTPSVAPSMMASDDSDLDSLASLRMDLPASDSVPVSKRSIANSLLKKIGRKYNVKKLNTLYLNKTRNILEVGNKPQLLPTPGIPASEKDLEEMSPEQRRVATFFRKETVDNYRRNFEGIIMKNGINDFAPILYESRTRNKTKQIQDAATIKSVFGLDIPPHILKKNEGKKGKKVIKKVEKDKKEEPKKEESCASTPIGSVLAAGEEDEDSELRSERSESVLGESSVSHVPKRVRRKFRKFRSGFDYIRKKKKVKADDEAAPSRKRFPVRKHVNWPEQSRDVASEVRAWVVNKGLGETVLHKAARLQYHDVVVYCAESPDFDINVRDNAGYTPLHEACNRGHLDIAQVLCAHGAHVNAPGYKGMRPLHEAVENAHGELARLLLAYGADPTLTTYAGQTCLALSADIQSTRLIEGFMADLKGQRIVDLWYFAGPARFLDPEEQGCYIFENIPGSNILQLRENDESKQENDKKLEDPVLLEISSVDGSGKCQNTLDDHNDKDSSVHKPVKLEGVSNEPNSSLKQKTLDPKVQEKEKTRAECSIKESESIVESDLAKKSEVKPGEINNLVKKEEVSDNKPSDAAAASTSQELELDSESDAELNGLVFETCESEMLDLFEVQGRPHKYLLLPDLLQQLKISYKEFIVSAKTVETLELSAEEFSNKASCCIVGSVRPCVVEDCSRVVLVRVTPTIEELLGIETVKL